MNLLALAAVVLPSAFVGGALAWLFAERGRHQNIARSTGDGGTLRVAGLPGAGLAVTVRLPVMGAAQKVA